MGDSKTSNKKKFMVLRTGIGPQSIEKKYGGYGTLLVELLGEPGETWDMFSVFDDEFPDHGKLEEYNGCVITGSPADAHADDAWILKLCELIRHLHKLHMKILGICFGHQVLSRALGGKTGRASVGWELGLKEINVDPELVHNFYGIEFPSTIKIVESHRDQEPCSIIIEDFLLLSPTFQVSSIPPYGLVLASSAKTDIEIFAVGNSVLGIQGHPEFNEDIISTIAHSRLACGAISESVAEEAISSFKNQQADQEILRNFCKHFLQQD